MPARTKPRSADDRTEPTLIRLGPELLGRAKAEAARNGVPLAQWLREAVVMRIAFDEGSRDGRVEALHERTARAREDSERLRSEQHAVLAENKLAVAQAQRRRDEARETCDHGQDI